MNSEKQFVTVLICKSPKTQILLDKRLPEEEKQKRISRYLDKEGKLKIDTVKNHNVYGIK
ncbi:hypothetical protein D0T66_06600 [Dysgonomonas sp. 25]|nr:hypothetical protein [Dysgonomonas sp. 25]